MCHNALSSEGEDHSGWELERLFKVKENNSLHEVCFGWSESGCVWGCLRSKEKDWLSVVKE